MTQDIMKLMSKQAKATTSFPTPSIIMLKHDIKKYFWQSAKTLSICFQWNTTHSDLLMCNCFWFEQLNVSGKYGILSDQYIRFIE